MYGEGGYAWIKRTDGGRGVCGINELMGYVKDITELDNPWHQPVQE